MHRKNYRVKMFDKRLLLFLILLCEFKDALTADNNLLESTQKGKHIESSDIHEFNSSHESADTKDRQISESYDFRRENNEAEVENNNRIKVNESPTESINYTKSNNEVNPIDSMGNKNTKETDITSGPEKINDEKKANETNGLDESNATVNVMPSAEFANTTYEQSDLANYHHQLIDYISHLCCYDGSYQFIHIYVERSLVTPMADTLIMQLNHCMAANILTTRYLLCSVLEENVKTSVSAAAAVIIKCKFLIYLHPTDIAITTRQMLRFHSHAHMQPIPYWAFKFSY